MKNNLIIIHASHALASKAPCYMRAHKAEKPRSNRLLSFMLTIAFMLGLASESAYADTSINELLAEIADAQSLLNQSHAKISTNGWDIYVGDFWWTNESYVILEQAIAAATAVAEGTPKSNYDEDILPLNTKKVFYRDQAKNDGLKYDYSALNNIIAAAEDSISPAHFAVSVDGFDVDFNKKWSSQYDLDTFKSLIDDAKQLKTLYGVHGDNANNAATNQIAINNKAALLQSQITGFVNSHSYGYKPDYSEMNDSIAKAKQLYQTTVVSATGDDIPVSAWYTTAQGNLDNLQAAITVAENYVSGNLAAQSNILASNQANVSVALSTLVDAINVFYGLRIQGGNTTLYSYIDLDYAVTTAQAAIDAVEHSDNGNDIEPSDSWAYNTAVSTLQTLINTATAKKTVYGLNGPDLSTTQTNQGDIDAAATALSVGVTTFLGTVINGGYKPDYSVLNALIDSAITLLNSTNLSVDGHEYPASVAWVSPSDWSALDVAVSVANNHVSQNDLATNGNLATNQLAVDDAKDILDAAITAFLSQIHQGDAPDPADIIALRGLVNTAEAKLTYNGSAVVGSVNNGNDIIYGSYWVTAVKLATLQNAIAAARAIVDANPYTGSQSQVQTATTALSSAISNFGAPQNGKGANTSILDDEIATALLLKDSVDMQKIKISVHPSITSPDGSDVEYAIPWVSQADTATLIAALNAAQTAKATFTPSTALHTQVQTLELALRAAISSFNSNKTLNSPDMAKPNYDILQAKIDAALADTVNIKTSQLGGAEVPDSLRWVTPPDLANFLMYITTAQNIYNLQTASVHGDILAAIDDLTQATINFRAAIRRGLKSPYILVSNLPDGFVGAQYTSKITIVQTGVQCTVTGLPNGVTFDPQTGELGGMATRADTFTVTIAATNPSLGATVNESRQFDIVIHPSPVVNFSDSIPVKITDDIVITFPVKMNTEVTGTVTANHRQLSGYWTSETTYVIIHADPSYEYDWDYTIVITGLKDKTNNFVYESSFSFRTETAPALPTINRRIKLLPLPEGVASDPIIDELWVNSGDDFTFALIVAATDKLPSVQTNRIVNDNYETVVGVPDAETPNRYVFVITDIHQHIEITVSLENKSDNSVVAGERTQVWAHDGKLYVETTNAGQLSIYSISGALCKQTTVVGSYSLALPKGVYIARLNGQTYKIALQ